MGAAGIAYFLMRHAAFSGDSESLAAASWWAAYADDLGSSDGALASPDGSMAVVPGDALHYHRPGVTWTRSLVATALGDTAQAQRSRAAFAEAAAGGGKGETDVNWGAAGLLLGCAQLGVTLDGDVMHVSEEVGHRLAAALIDFIPSGSLESETMPVYLGAAHGWAGIVQALLRWNAVTGASPSVALDLLERLLSYRRPSGRWPVRAGTRQVYRGWCHGSAGWAMVWAQAWWVTREDRMLAIAEECAADAVADDTSLPSLCCGRGGQAFAALTVYQATGDEHWLADAKRIVTSTVAALPEDDPEAHQLFSGQLGVALAALELEDPRRAAMPVFQAIT